MRNNTFTKNVVYYSAWGVILGVLLFIVSTLIGGREILQVQSIVNPIIFTLAVLRVVNIIYPIAILRLAVKEKNYKFLNSPVHYFALPLCLLMWVGQFL